MKSAFLFLPISFFLFSCATAPVKTEFNNTRQYSLSKDAAWEKVIEYFASNNIQIKTLEKESGIIAAEPGTVPSEFLNCGKPGLAIPRNSFGVANVFVKSTGSSSTVTVNASYKQTREIDRRRFNVDCFSTGVFEQNVLDSISS